jgi:hypothetical protein
MVFTEAAPNRNSFFCATEVSAIPRTKNKVNFKDLNTFRLTSD